jgi:outer membrane protein TolC
LQGYISKGLQNNLDIRIAMQNIVAAIAMKQGKAGYFPSLSVGTDWTHQMLSKTVSLSIPSRSEYRSIPISRKPSWEADIWGK